MVSLEELKEQRSKLLMDGIANNIKRSAFGADEIEYLDPSEMVVALEKLDREIAALEGRSSIQIVNIRSQGGWS